MSINLTDDQALALDSQRHIFVEAGAGSGKTRILVERYLHILSQHPELDLSSIVAFTFTQKAAQEMMLRLQETIDEGEITPDGPNNRFKKELRNKVIDQIHTAPISTIHQFCLRCLKQFPLEAGIDPDIALLDPLHAGYLFNQSIQEILTTQIAKETPLLLSLLEISSLSQLKKDIQVLCKNHAFLTPQTLETHALQTLEEVAGSKDEGVTQSAHIYTQQLHQLYQLCHQHYQSKKKHYGKCDFDDLIRHTIDLIESHPSVRLALQKKHRFLMVDEFQDTDPLQWQLIQALIGGSGDPSTYAINLFLVGDLKQSIYSFRGATADLFTTVQAQFREHPSHTRVISLKDNFRSHSQLMTCFNNLFPPILQNDTDNPINYQALRAHRDTPKGGQLHTLFQEGSHLTFQDEIVAMAHWIQAHKQAHPETGLEDIAILFRRKAPMEVVKKNLELLGIPTQILSQQSLYQNQAIIDAYNVLKAIIHPQDNLAWRSILRSPFFGWSESDVYTLFKTTLHHTIPQRLLNPPSDLDDTHQAKWAQASATIHHLLTLSKTNPLSMCLDTLLTDSGAWAVYARLENGETICQMLESFLDKCRDLETELALSPLDMLDIIEESIQAGEREKEASVARKPGHVVILSIHGAKGLEFPVVLLPECQKTFNFASMQRLLFSPDLGIGLSLKKGDAENKHRNKVLTHIKALTIEEEKRLFYVACTRAIDHLVLVGHYAPDKIAKHSYLGFLSQVGTFSDGQFKTPIELPGLTAHTNTRTTHPKKSPHKKNQLSLFQTQLSSPIIPKETTSIDDKTDDIPTTQLLTPQFLGTLCHQALQQLIQAPDRPLDVIARQIVHQNILPAYHHTSTIQHLIRHMEIVLKHPIMSQISSAQQLETEKPFSYKKGHILLRGRVDLFYIHNDTLTIVDFKTSRNTPAEHTKNRDTYKEQIQKYAAVLTHIYRPISQINGLIIQTHLDLTDSWTWTSEEIVALNQENKSRT